MESVFTTLQNRGVPEEPLQSRLLKSYVQKKYGLTPQIISSPNLVTVVVSNSALAGNLRMDIPDMVRKCQIATKLRIRIS